MLLALAASSEQLSRLPGEVCQAGTEEAKEPRKLTEFARVSIVSLAVIRHEWTARSEWVPTVAHDEEVPGSCKPDGGPLEAAKGHHDVPRSTNALLVWIVSGLGEWDGCLLFETAGTPAVLLQSWSSQVCRANTAQGTLEGSLHEAQHPEL